MMTQDEAFDYIIDIRDAIALSKYSDSKGIPLLNVYQRMLCHKLISALYKVVEGRQEMPQYVLPLPLNLKLQNIIAAVKSMHWKRPEVYYDESRMLKEKK